MDLGFLKWIDHAGFLMEVGGKRVYIDPYRIVRDMPKADVIFVTHSHHDHLSEEAIDKIATGKTQFVAPKESAEKLTGRDTLLVEPGKSYTVQGIAFTTVAAYNVNKFRSPGVPYHPKASGMVGYVIDAGGTGVYHAGDTDATEEVLRVETDVALLPIGGTYTMTLAEAIAATRKIRADVFVPMHYKAVLGQEGSRKAEDEFKRMVRKGVVLKQVQEPYYSF